MKRSIILFSLLTFLFSNIQSANLKADEKVTITEVQNDDCYIGGGEIKVNAPVFGDLVVGGGEIDVDDSVSMDILAAGGQIELNGAVGDDVRVSGGQVDISSHVKGDLIAFGGQLTLSKNARIDGDVIVMGGELELIGDVGGDVMVYGGKVTLENTVFGNVEMKAGEVEFNGVVKGNMLISADDIELGENASCEGEIRYWTSDGEMDFSAVCDNASYDESLAFTDENVEKSVLIGLFGMGIISYWIFVILSVILMLIILEYFFSGYFDQAVQRVRSSFVTCFGYGMLYTLGMPVLILISFIIIIGIPIGLFGLGVYLTSLVIATTAIGLSIAHHFNNKSGKKWSKFQLILYATLTVVILKVIFWIPALGQLLKTVAIAAVYGAFLMMAVERRRQKKAEA